MRYLFTSLLSSILLAALVGCSTNPATGDRALTFLSWESEISMGAEAASGMTQEFGGETPSPEAQAYVDEVGQKLLQGIEEGIPEMPWEFTLLDSSVINAFALPGGKVFLSRGLADKLKNEAEMAGVIGHEIGHVTARHGNQRISKQLGFNIGLAAAALVVGASDENSDIRQYGEIGLPALAISGNVVLLKYGRDEELEADMLGIRYMTRAGYNPVGQRNVMQILKAASGGSSQPEWLSTHPASDTRIDRINELLQGEYAFTQNNPEYVLEPEVYERRMLRPLASLGPPRHGTGRTASLLENTSLWCAHCRGESEELALSE